MSSLDTTPNRRTRIVLDIPETVLISEAWTYTRRSEQINPPAQKGQTAFGTRAFVKYWPSGCWTLEPVQHAISNLSELSANTELIIGPDKFTLINVLIAAGTTALVAQENSFRRQNDIPGINYQTGVLASGDPFLTKRLPAGVSSANLLTDIRPAPLATSAVAPMDRVGIGTVSYPENQGFYLRFTVPGTARAVADYVWGFHFGQYALFLRGTGLAELFEYCHNTDGDAVTHQRAQFRYCEAGRVTNTAHALMIFPHVGPGGEKYLAFSGARSETNVLSTGAAYNVADGEFLYVADASRRGSDTDESPGAATAAGVIRLDIRRDQKPKIQVSKLGFAVAGTLIDLPPPASLPPLYDDTPPTILLSTTGERGPFRVTPTLLDSTTNQTYRPGVDTSPYVGFDFTGDLASTPFLWGYTVHRPELTQKVAAGAFEIPLVREVSQTGCTDDPTLTTASARISDLGGTLPRLHTRGLFSAKILVDVNGGDPDLEASPARTTVPIDTSGPLTLGFAQTVVLHRGYVNRPTSVRRGRQVVRRDGSRPPYPNWRDYELSFLSTAMRLQEGQAGAFDGSFALDPDAPPDPQTQGQQPWKVTDKIRRLLYACGFAPSEVLIPDLPQRLWPGQNFDRSALTLRAYADLCEEIVTTARNYLGAYVIWNENAGPVGTYGPEGRWELLFGTPPNTAPIWNFVTRAQFDGVPPNLAGAYAPLTTWVSPGSSEQTIPPDFNVVTVIGGLALAGTNTQIAISNVAYNPKACNFPGFTTRADPNHPDYFGGRLRALKVIDYTLAGPSYEATQRAVDWTVRRLYDFTCHAQRIRRFRAPLVLIFDAAIGRLRPLRFQDPVSYQDGDGPVVRYLVKSVNPHLTSDHHQMAEYELIRPIDDQPGSAQGFLGRSGVAFLRRANQTASLKAAGSSGVGSLLSAGSSAPHAERVALNAPLYTPTRKPLQDETGAFFPLAGYDSPVYDGARRPQ